MYLGIYARITSVGESEWANECTAHYTWLRIEEIVVRRTGEQLFQLFNYFLFVWLVGITTIVANGSTKLPFCNITERTTAGFTALRFYLIYYYNGIWTTIVSAKKEIQTQHSSKAVFVPLFFSLSIRSFCRSRVTREHSIRVRKHKRMGMFRGYDIACAAIEVA